MLHERLSFADLQFAFEEGKRDKVHPKVTIKSQ